jgi:hypothetical protein
MKINADLLNALINTQAELAACASQIDAIIQCQQSPGTDEWTN